MLALYPAAASVASNDGLLPMHVLLSAADSPPLSFTRALMLANIESLTSWATDIVPASTGTGNKNGSASGQFLFFIHRLSIQYRMAFLFLQGWEINTPSGRSTVDLEM